MFAALTFSHTNNTAYTAYSATEAGVMPQKTINMHYSYYTNVIE